MTGDLILLIRQASLHIAAVRGTAGPRARARKPQS